MSEKFIELNTYRNAGSLPELEGRDAQVNWAESIRLKAIAKYKQAGKDAPTALTKTTSSKWFIDNRERL